MSKRNILIGLAAVVVLGVVGIASTPMRPNPTTYQVWSGTSGAADPHTLTKAAITFCIKNNDATATNTLTVSFNGGSDFTIRGGDSFCIDHSDGFVVQSFIVTDLNGTPTWQAIAFEMP